MLGGMGKELCPAPSLVSNITTLYWNHYICLPGIANYGWILDLAPPTCPHSNWWNTSHLQWKSLYFWEVRGSCVPFFVARSWFTATLSKGIWLFWSRGTMGAKWLIYTRTQVHTHAHRHKQTHRSYSIHHILYIFLYIVLSVSKVCVFVRIHLWPNSVKHPGHNAEMISPCFAQMQSLYKHMQEVIIIVMLFMEKCVAKM